MKRKILHLCFLISLFTIPIGTLEAGDIANTPIADPLGGKCIEGDCISGQGTYVYPDGMRLYKYKDGYYDSSKLRWRCLGNSVASNYRVYYHFYDTETIIIKGEYVRIWTMVKSPSDKEQYKALIEYDCRERKIRILQGIAYPSRESFTSPTKWEYVIPDSTAEPLYKTFCPNE